MKPFKPKSTSKLRPGHIWPIKLKTNLWACGIVLELNTELTYPQTKSFYGGLLEWKGETEPTANSIVNSNIIQSGIMHIKSITEMHSEITDYVDLEKANIQIPYLLSCIAITQAELLKGTTPIRKATKSDSHYPVISHWGYDCINELANEILK